MSLCIHASVSVSLCRCVCQSLSVLLASLFPCLCLCPSLSLATSQVLSQLKHLQGQEDSGAVPSLRTLRGSCRLGLKVYISSPTGQNYSLTLLTRNETHSANC